MKTIIEVYRGFEISFDTVQNKFYALSNEFDKDFYKNSYPASKKFIDDFIKENVTFKEFDLILHPDRGYNREKIRVIGIRKDGAFVYRDQSGHVKQLSKYSESDYMLPHKDDNVNFEAIDKIRKERERLNLERVKIVDRLKNVLFKDYAEELRKKYENKYENKN
jgi:hypothetical protein